MLNKFQRIKNKKLKKVEFTGERLIPEFNKGQAFFYEHLARYLFACQFAKNKIILDAGCGVGYGSYILAKYGKAKKVFGVDISEDSITYAKENYNFKNIKFNVDNVEIFKTISNKSVDLVVSFEVIEHLKNQKKFLKQIKRVLKENGMFIVSTPNKYTYPPGNPFHTKELYPEEFFQLLKQYFKNVKFYHQSFELAQLIKEEGKEIFNLEETFQILTQKVYASPLNKKNSQYLLAICSDNALPKTTTLSITSSKVDNFDLSKGIFSLGEQFNRLINHNNALFSQNSQLYQQINTLNSQLSEYFTLKSQLEQTKAHIQNLETQLNTIKSAKFFKLWQFYNRVKKFIKFIMFIK